MIREGEPGDTLHVIDKGRAIIQVSTAMGDKTILSVRGPGDVLGELSLFDEGRRTASVYALEPVETLVLTHSALNRLRTENPRVDRYLAELLSGKLAELTQQLMEVLYLPVEQRVLRVLDRLADAFERDSSEPTVVVIRQEDLAAMAGTRRQTASRPLKDAEAAGAIAIGRGRITVLDREHLRSLAG